MIKHGGNVRKARELYGNKEFIDFSSNINPLGLDDAIKEALASAILTVTQYPDPDCTDLRRALAVKHDIPTDYILCGNGASELLFLGLQSKKPKKVALFEPCFLEYEAAIHASGAEIVPISFLDDFQFPWEQIPWEAIDMIVMGNPNNPTSTCLSQHQMEKLLQKCTQHEVVLFIDEAFNELTLAKPSMIPYVKNHDNLFVLRAFTKSLAIPGARLGYAITNPSWIQAMKKKQITWSVNAFAQSIASAIPHLRNYWKRTDHWMQEEYSYSYQAMQQIETIQAWKPHTNFMLWRCEQKNLVEKMAEKGILIRSCSNFKQLDATYFRTAIRAREENDRLIHALKEVLI